MMASQFTSAEWDTIRATLAQDPEAYGLPQREYGSILLGSFNVRKLGSSRNRSPDTWEFLADVCRSFDLVSVQEIMDDLSGLRRLMSLLGPDYSLVVSDQTGVFPGELGLGERLGFIYRWPAVERMEVASDITFDRSKVIDTIAHEFDAFASVVGEYADKLSDYETGARKTKPKLKLPLFLTFIRQPFCVSFRIAGHPGTEPYEFMAVNAHLYYGNYIADRRREFDALMEWVLGRAEANLRAYYPNFILLGDLNLDFDNPETDRARIEQHMKSFNNAMGDEVNVYFPFLDAHPTRLGPFRTNARLTQTFDQIGFFSRDPRLPVFGDNAVMGQHPRGPDYGVFEFVRLFSDALLQKPYDELAAVERSDFLARFEYKVSDHMPLWVRLPLPG